MRLPRPLRFLRRLRRRRGRILAVKWGFNPNSSSLGVDVTFLLFGMAAVVLLTPIVSLLLRARQARRAQATVTSSGQGHAAPGDDAPVEGG